MFKSILLSFALGFSLSATAMEPLYPIAPYDEDYDYYSYLLSGDGDLVKEGYTLPISVFDGIFNTWGRVTAVRDGWDENPYNVVVAVNGELYYVPTDLAGIDTDENGVMFKMRRRWANDPEPGVFLRVAGYRIDPFTGESQDVQVWIKIADINGDNLPKLVVFEGNYDK